MIDRILHLRMSRSNATLWIGIASLVVACHANCGSWVFPRKLQLVPQTFTGKGTSKSKGSGTGTTSVSGSVDFDKMNLRFVIEQRGDGGSQETGYIQNTNAGTVANMAKDGEGNRTCTLDAIPGIVKTFMNVMLRRLIKQAKAQFKCIGSSSDIDTFEVDLSKVHSKLLPEGTNGTVDVKVDDKYLWKDIKAVYWDEDEGRVETEMTFSSRAGGPTDADMTPPASWNCKPATGSASDGMPDAAAQDTMVMNTVLSLFGLDSTVLPAVADAAVHV